MQLVVFWDSFGCIGKPVRKQNSLHSLVFPPESRIFAGRRLCESKEKHVIVCFSSGLSVFQNHVAGISGDMTEGCSAGVQFEITGCYFV